MRLGARVQTLIDEGPYSGAEATVDQIVGWAVYAIARGRLGVFLDAESGTEAEIAALRAIAGLYVEEARPVWNLEDQRGPIQPSVSGFLRLPVMPLAIRLYEMWLASFEADGAAAVEPSPPPDPVAAEAVPDAG